MNTGPTLKEQQLAWAIAWQDHGDRAALTRLCESVEGFVIRHSRKDAKRYEQREELLAEYRLAVVEAAGVFDRNRPDGFLALCAFYMLPRRSRVYRHSYSPATVPERVWAPAMRIVVDDAENTPHENLRAAQPYSEGDSSLVTDAIDAAGLSAREWRVLQRYARGETLEDLAKLWEVSPARAGQIEVGARAKVRRVLQARGLSLEDLL